MLYEKLLSVLLVLFAANALQIHKFSRSSLFRGSVFKVNHTLVYVSNSDNSVSLTWVKVRKRCHISFPSVLKSSNYTSFVKVTVLGNNKIILRSYESNGSRIAWRFLAVDHQNCFSHSIEDQLQKDFQDTGISAVIAYNDSFDIFSDNKVCSPCRYNEKGEKLELRHTLVQTNLSELGNFRSRKDRRISTIKENDPAGGYLLVQVFGNNCTTLLQRLDSRFQVVIERYLNVTVEATSTDYEKLRICSLPHCKTSISGNHDSLTCQILNIENFDTLNISKLDQVSSGKDIKSLIVQNLPDGSAKVTYVYDKECFMGDGEGAFAEVYDQIINTKGVVENPTKFQETIVCWDYRLDSIVLGPDEYCTIAYDGVATLKNPQTVYQTCARKI